MRSIIFNVIIILSSSRILYALPEMPNNILNQPVGQPKSVAVGYCWSSCCTILPLLLPYALIVLSPTAALAASPLPIFGILVGPCAGHFYASQWKRGLVTIGIRIGSIAIAATQYNASWVGDENEFLLLAGVIGLLGSTVYDFWTIPSSVRKYNSDHGFQIKSELNMIENQYRLGLAWRF